MDLHKLISTLRRERALPPDARASWTTSNLKATLRYYERVILGLFDLFLRSVLLRHEVSFSAMHSCIF
jgi:hypothetical protein